MLLVTACGGAAAAAADPSSAVKAAFDAASSGGLAKLDDFACAAQKGKLAECVRGRRRCEQLTQRRRRARADVMSAMSIKFDNVTTKESSRTDKDATVHVNGNMTVTVDADEVQADPEDDPRRPRACPTTTRRSTRR